MDILTFRGEQGDTGVAFGIADGSACRLIPYDDAFNASMAAAAPPSSPQASPAVALVWSKNSCGFARVVFQEPAEPFTTLYRALTRRVLADDRKEQHVVFALVIPLMTKMLDILRQHMAERSFPKQDHPCKTLLFDGTYPPLRVGIQIR